MSAFDLRRTLGFSQGRILQQQRGEFPAISSIPAGDGARPGLWYDRSQELTNGREIRADMLTESDIPTPGLVIDLAVVERNLQRAAGYASEHGIKIRPHTKTHKLLSMARRQLAHGAGGLTVAKVGEAQVMSAASRDLLLAYPYVDPNRLNDLMELARHNSLRVAVDTIDAAKMFGEATAAAGVKLGVLVDLDIGFHRTGVQTPAEALAIAQQIGKFPSLQFDGLFFYPGHLNKQPLVEPGLADASRIVRETIELLKNKGIAVKTVSGGSTPTLYSSHLVPELTEIRPGTYIYNDRNELAAGWASLDQCAARMVCTVVSTAVPGKMVINAGSKTLTSDRLGIDPMNGGFGMVVEYPSAKISRLSEEHGEVELDPAEGKPKVGQRVHVIPNHICPCVNLHDFIWLKQADGSVEQTRIDARGMTT